MSTVNSCCSLNLALSLRGNKQIPLRETQSFLSKPLAPSMPLLCWSSPAVGTFTGGFSLFHGEGQRRVQAAPSFSFIWVQNSQLEEKLCPVSCVLFPSKTLFHFQALYITITGKKKVCLHKNFKNLISTTKTYYDKRSFHQEDVAPLMYIHQTTELLNV